MKYLIKGGRVIDPAEGVDDILDILVSSGKIESVGKNLSPEAKAVIIDAKNKIVSPGFIDMHTHLREPGREDKETVFTGTKSAVRGGFTGVACMPNTEPAIDNQKHVRLLKGIITKDALTNVFIVGAITEARSGKILTDIKAMKKEGIIAISDDGSSVEDEDVMYQALKESKKEKVAVIAHCEDTKLSSGGVMNKGFISTKMGLKGIPARAEFERVERDITLAKKAASPIHIAHVSCRESVELIRKAKKEGVRITAETAPHYFSLTEDCCVTYDTNVKMNPPLRSTSDVESIKAGLRDGTIDAIATDHAPHTDAEKDVEFDFAPFGIIGLETALGVAALELIDKKVLSWAELIRKLSTNPAKILGLEKGSLRKGSDADITILDPNREYVYKKEFIESKSKNSPFIDWRLKAKVTDVLVGGKLVMQNEKID